MSSGSDPRSELDMHWYQDNATEFLKLNRFAALFVDLGLGKTIICLTLIIYLLFVKKVNGKVLVIAPIRVATQTWPNEIEEWEHTIKWLRNQFVVIRAEDDDPEVVAAGKEAAAVVAQEEDFFKVGARSKDQQKAISSARSKAMTAKKEEIRQRLLRSELPVHIIDNVHVEWLVDQFSTWEHKRGRKHDKRIIADWPYRTVIIDESTAFADYKSARFIALSVVRIQGFISRLHLLTATPASDSFMSLMPQIFLLDVGQRLGRVITHYRDKFFTKNPYTKQYELIEGSEEAISDKIADITMVMEAKDYLKLEEPTQLPRPLKLEKEDLDAYRRFERTAVFDFSDGRFVEAVNAGVLSGKLMQLSSGAMYGPEGETVTIHDVVMDDLEQLVDELQGSPLLVLYWYKSSIQRLKKRFPKLVEMDKAGKRIKDWNLGKIEFMPMHPASAAHGLNMQYGPGHDIYAFDGIFSNQLYKQAVGRIARQGQKQPVRIHQPRVLGTAHEDVYDNNGRKEDCEQRLKRRIRKIRETL